MDTTGMRMGEGMEEAMRRMEAGEDPGKVEEELGDVLDGRPLFDRRKQAPGSIAA